MKTSLACMKSISLADSEHLYAVILDCLVRLNLNIHLVRGQGYDGAAVMSGVQNGVASKISAIEPWAVYIHCATHHLNLALQDSAQQVTIIRNALHLTCEMINFILKSYIWWHQTTNPPNWHRSLTFGDVTASTVPHTMDGTNSFIVVSGR